MGLIGPTKKQLGERAQAHVIAKCLEVGYNVLVPYGDSSRYDLVIEDDEGRFWRVQVKSAWIEGGNKGTSSSQLPRCAHAQLTGMLHTRMHLRLAPSKNKQERGVHWAADYEI